MNIYLPVWFMNRYRGKRGFFGRLVLDADRRCLNAIVEAVCSRHTP